MEVKKILIAVLVVLVVGAISLNFEKITGGVSKAPKYLSYEFDRGAGISKLVVEVNPAGKPNREILLEYEGEKTGVEGRFQKWTKCDWDYGTQPGKSDCVREIVEFNLVQLVPGGKYTASLVDYPEVEPITIMVPTY